MDTSPWCIAIPLIGVLTVLQYPACVDAQHLTASDREAEVATDDEPSLVRSLIAARWNLARSRAALPPVQVVSRDATEIEDFVQYAYDGGALRLCVSPGPKGGDIFALIVDTRVPRYARYAHLAATPGYVTYYNSAYTIVVPLRPLSQEVFDQLKARTWTEPELQQQLGAPSYHWHMHGIGHFGLTYVPEGLSFIGDFDGPGSPVVYQVHVPVIECKQASERFDFGLPPLTSLSDLDYGKLQPECRESFAHHIFGERDYIDRALANGKRSPDGRFAAALVNIAGPGYSGELVIRETGKPERRYQGASWTGDKDYLWLNSRVVVFKTYWAGGEDFYTFDTSTGVRKLAAHLGYENEPDPHHHAVDFGVSGPNRFWYKTEDGQTHTITVGR